MSGQQRDGTDVENLARQYFLAWAEALRQPPGGAAAAAGNDPGDWTQVLDWWAQLLPERGPGPVEDVLQRLRGQAGGWYGTMQQVAARFAGRDATSAEVAQAWREAVMGQGGGLLDWMLQGTPAGGGAAGADDIGAAFARWQEQLSPWLQGPAFGPGREHQARWQTLVQAQQEFQARSREYTAQIRQALEEAFALFETRLAERETPGSQLTSARAMFDLWIEAAEDAYAKVALSEAFQQVYAALGNAQMRLRAAVQREVEQLSGQAGLPTRSEMDAAHRRIAELERQLRRLQASVERAAQAAAAVPPSTPPPAPRRRARAGTDTPADGGTPGAAGRAPRRPRTPRA